MYCSNCGRELPERVKFCPDCGAPRMVPRPVSPVPGQGMGWHKFLVNFALWAGAVISLASGIYGLANLCMETALIPPLRVALLILNDLLALGSGVLSVIARSHLAAYRADGPKKLTVVYMLAIATNFLSLLNLIILPLPGISADLLETAYKITRFVMCAYRILIILGQLVVLFATRVYYKNRKYLFVN